jgi:hypothetical protein
MKIHIDMDMAKDKFDYRAVADPFNVLYRGSKKAIVNEKYIEWSNLMRTL